MQTIKFDKLAIGAHHRLLDLGCGQGRHSLYAHHFTAAETIIGLDLNEDDVRLALRQDREFAACERPKSRYTVAEGAHLPFGKHAFDCVICSEVLEHIDDYRSVLSEILRVLKPGGTLAISVPRSWPERLCWRLSDDYYNVPGGHVRIFRERELRQQIKDLGFDWTGRHWAHALHTPYWWLKCLLWQHQDQSKLVALYHRFLVWDLMKKPLFSRLLESLLNPLIGKSVVLYFVKKAD